MDTAIEATKRRWIGLGVEFNDTVRVSIGLWWTIDLEIGPGLK